MHLSLSRKILFTFAILISFTVVQGLLLYFSLHRFHQYSDDIRRVREFQFIVHTMENLEIHSPETISKTQKNFEQEYYHAKELLSQMDALSARLEKVQQKHLLEADDFLDNYYRAFTELNELHIASSALHTKALNAYSTIIGGERGLPAENATTLFPLLLELFTLEVEVLEGNEVTLIPALKKVAGQIRALTSEQTILSSLHNLVAVAEQSYLNALAIVERTDFLNNTAEHFYAFTSDILTTQTRNTDRLQRNVLWLMAGLIATAVIACILLFLVTRNYFKAFLRHQREAITAIENGRYGYPLPPNLPADELGDLARFTKKMAGTLQQNAEEISASQQKLRRSEEHVRIILNSAAEAIYGLDCEGCCTFANNSMLRLLGFEREEELLGKNIHDVIHHHYPDGREYPWEQCIAHRSCLQSGEIHSEDEVYFHRDGTAFPAECWAYPLIYNGEMAGSVVTFLDITKRKAAEQALKSSEQLYRTLIEQIDLGITLIDRDHNIIMTNSAQGRLFGRDQATFRGRKCFREFEQRDEICSHCPGVNAMATRMPQEAIATGVREDGSPLTVRIRAFPVFGADDAVTGFIEVVEEISRQLKAERELAEEKERLAVTLRSIGDGVIATDTAGRIVLINKVAEQLCGWPMAEAVGRPLEEVFRIVNEQTGAPCENPVDKALATGMTVNLANHTILIAKDGTRYSIADSGAPIRNQESKIIGVVLVFRDVTEKQKMEEEAFKSRKLDSIGVLAGGIAHDFNNILAAVLGNINLVRHIIAPGEKRAHTFLAEAEKASVRARNLTQQLLTFAKGGEPVRTAASIIEIIKDSTEFVLRGSGIKYAYDLPANLWPVDVDAGQISQVVQNLVLNARHAMPGGGTVTVTCRNVGPDDEGKPALLAHDGRFVRIDIADTGIGIPATIIDNIFDPYFSTKKEGSGLGLSICHSVIERHHGHIAVRSEQGNGSVFTFFLPAAEPAAVPAEQVPHGEKVLANLDMTVLIMDDDEQVREIAAAMLGHLGCRVLLAEDGEEALAIYRAHKEGGQAIDAVIMDLTIPGGMGGKEAVRELLQLDPTARVLVSSGYSTDPVMASFRQFGFCGAIVKPYQLRELARVISEAAAGR